MGKALECPACGAKHRLDGPVPDATFRCDRCGQKLKVPSSVAAGLPPRRAVGEPGSARVGPPPRRRASGATAPTVIGASATVDTAGAPTRAVADDNGQPPGTPRAVPATGSAPGRVRWYWRLLAWIAAIPLGFLVGVVPAYEFGFVEKDDVLDLFVGSGADRYIRLGIVTLFWALATAVLVQVFVEGGRWWSERRRRTRRARQPSARGAAARG